MKICYAEFYTVTGRVGVAACGRRWAWLADGGVRAAAGTGRARLRLASDHLQHDELARGELVRQRHDRLLVVADEHAEHVHAGIDRRHRRPVRRAPHADRVVARPGHGQLVVVRQRAAPDLHIHTDDRMRGVNLAGTLGGHRGGSSRPGWRRGVWSNGDRSGGGCSRPSPENFFFA